MDGQLRDLGGSSCIPPAPTFIHNVSCTTARSVSIAQVGFVERQNFLLTRSSGALKLLLRLNYGDIAELKRRRGICSRTKLDKSGNGFAVGERKGGD